MQVSNIREAIGVLGITGRDSGDEIHACCPLHSERRPSFYINAETGLWKCHAGCGGGNLYQLAEKLTGSSTKARRMLSFYSPRKLRTISTPADLDIVDEDAWRAITREPPAEQLRSRGIGERIARDLGIRFNPFNPLPGKDQAPGSDPCWMIPMRSPEDYGLIGWQAKGTVSGDAMTTGKKNMTLFGIELGGIVATFGTSVGKRQKELLIEMGTLIVVESPLDVAVLRTAGIMPGAFIIAFDNDGPGRKATATLARARDIPNRFVFNYSRTPEAKDPGDMTPDQNLWAVENAIPAAKWLTENADKATA